MEDKLQVDGVRLMAWNPNLDLEFYDESVRSAFDSSDAEYIRRRIREKLRRCSTTLGLFGPETWHSRWVNWEINTSREMGLRLIFMAVKDAPRQMTFPSSVLEGENVWMWDASYLAAVLSRPY